MFLTCEKLYLSNLELRSMADAFMFAGILYLFLGLTFDITSEIALYRRVRLGKTIIQYGLNKAILLEKETRAYQHCISSFLSIGGLIYSALALFIQTSAELWLTLAGTIPHAVGLLLLGYWTCVLRFDKNFIVVSPYSRSRFLANLLVFLLIYPFFIGLLGFFFSRESVQIILDAFISISFLLTVLVITFPLILGGWLFGVATLTELIPFNLTNPVYLGLFLISSLTFIRICISTQLYILAAVIGFTASLYFTLFLIWRKTYSF
jgi:hypothetical protein